MSNVSHVVFLTVLLVVPARALSQEHSDVEFSYVDDMIHVAPPAGSNHLVFESFFPTTGIEQQFTTLPGIASEVDVGLGTGPGDEILYHVLDELLYWNGADFDDPPQGYEIHIAHQPASVPDTIVGAATGGQLGSLDPVRNRIGAADVIGDFHVDLQWRLQPNPFPAATPSSAFGVYGVKLRLATSAAGVADSDPLLFVFNLGLSNALFEQAVDQFATLLAPNPPGDYDGDGIVDAADYQIWQLQFGNPAQPPGSGADGNTDGTINTADYTLWRDSLGAGQASARGSAVGVPEPQPTHVVTIVAWLALLAQHHYRSAPA